MSFVTSSSSIATPVAKSPSDSVSFRIEPPHGLFNLRLGELWAYRELLYFFVWRDVKIRYKQTLIGVVWVVLQPLLTMLVATLFFGKLAKLPSQGLPYPVFSFAAVVPWTYFSSAVLNTTNVVVENQRVITKVYFPRLILPISAAFRALLISLSASSCSLSLFFRMAFTLVGRLFSSRFFSCLPSPPFLA